MHAEKRTRLMTSYQQLPDLQRAVINILAVYYGYCTIGVLGTCLSDLGFTGKNNKPFKTVDLKQDFDALLKTGLIEEHANYGSRRCARLIAETITRQLVYDKQFENYASLIEKHTPDMSARYAYYTTPDDCLRDMHIHFHRGEYAKSNECLAKIHITMPDNIDIVLSWILNPLDTTWLTTSHPTIIKQLVGYIVLHQSLYLYSDPAVDSLVQVCLSNGTLLETNYAVRLAAELCWLRGDWEGLEKWLTKPEDPELDAIRAALTFLQGDYATAISQFEAALSALRKLTGKRTAYFYGFAGLFYPLAILKYGSDSQKAKLATLLSQAIKTQTHWTLFYQQLLLFQQFQQGDLSKRHNLLAEYTDYRVTQAFLDSGEPASLSTLPLTQRPLLLLIKYWVKAKHLQLNTLENYLPLHQYVLENGYLWLANELTTLFDQIIPGFSRTQAAPNFKQTPITLVDLFVSREDWDLALDALLNINPADNKSADSPTPAGKSTRLIWLLAYAGKTGTIIIEPREQKQQANGGWSKGRAIALKRLHTERDSFDYLSDQDQKICNTLKEVRDNSWYGTTYFEFGKNLPLLLVGHPLLFWAESPDVRVEVVKGEAVLRVNKQKGDKIRITLEPKPGYEENVHVSKETPTRLKVVELTAAHHKIYAVLGSGLVVPVSAQQRVLQALTRISGLLTVHSDIGGSSSTAEQVVADATPRVHLLPLGEGLRVAVLVRPFATDGAYFQPGQGGSSVLAEIDGKNLQAKRDLALEKKNSVTVFKACPSLTQAELDDVGDWLLPEPEQCLELLLQLQALPENQAIVEWPEGVKFKLLRQHSSSSFNMSIKRDNDWFSLQGELALNENTVIELQQLLGLLESGHGRFLRLHDGQFIALTDAFRRRLDDLKAYADLSGKKVRINPLAALSLEDWDDDLGTLKTDKHWQSHIQRLKSAQTLQPTLPSTFQAELRDYQMDGFVWLERLAHWGVGACLADDMGLGKTIQGLALLVDKAPNGPSFIVAPTSVCLNWESEAARFAPTLRPLFLGNGDRQRVLDNLEPYDVLICSYGLLQQEQVAEMLAKTSFQVVILDEAQAIKNTATRRSQGAMTLQAEFKIIMTGTPLENHLGELWNLFRFINPGLLGSLEQFNRRFAVPIERDQNPQARTQLKKLIQPFILRRTKTQVLQELPPRTEIPVYVELSSEEMAFYEALRRESLANLNNSDTQGGHKHLQILAAITKLRRSCCNSRLVSAEISLPSSKLSAFGDIVDELLDNKHKALVFSQFVDHLQLIKDYIEQRGIRYQYLDGSTPAKERQLRVNAFQRGESDLFLISLKAGGVGINLTAADYVIHMDPWWNPAVEDQASDRAHRMGQKRPVTIYRMIAKHTIEEKIVALHGQKRDLADSLLDGADVSGKISADALLELMLPEVS